MPTIKLLNQKGYVTQYSCSGHYGRDISNIYIKFYEDIFDDIINKNLPKGFKTEEGFIIRYSPNESLDLYTKFKYILKKNIELLDWVIKLPVLEY